MKHHSLIDKVFDPTNLRMALRHGVRRGGGPGSDGITWDRYRERRADNLRDLSCRLREERYSFGLPLQLPHRTHTGKVIDVFIWPVEDRVVQLAVGQVLKRVVVRARAGMMDHDRRPSTMEGWLRARQAMAPLMFVVDVKEWFASTKTEAAIASLLPQVADGRFLRLIRQALHVPNREGLPSGNPLAQVVAEWFIDTRKTDLPESELCRWYDSFGGLADSYRSAVERVAAIEASLEPLGLRLNPNKTLIMRSCDLIARLERFGYVMV